MFDFGFQVKSIKIQSTHPQGVYSIYQYASIAFKCLQRLLYLERELLPTPDLLTCDKISEANQAYHGLELPGFPTLTKELSTPHARPSLTSHHSPPPSPTSNHRKLHDTFESSHSTPLTTLNCQNPASHSSLRRDCHIGHVHGLDSTTKIPSPTTELRTLNIEAALQRRSSGFKNRSIKRGSA
jgi:hypothetical protein